MKRSEQMGGWQYMDTSHEDEREPMGFRLALLLALGWAVTVCLSVWMAYYLLWPMLKWLWRVL